MFSVANVQDMGTESFSSLNPYNLHHKMLPDAPSVLPYYRPTRSITVSQKNQPSSAYVAEQQDSNYDICCIVLNKLKSFSEQLKTVKDPDQRPTAQQIILELKAWEKWANDYKGSNDSRTKLWCHLATLPYQAVAAPSAEQEHKTHVLSAPVLMEHLSMQLGKLLEALPDESTLKDCPKLRESLDGMECDPDKILHTFQLGALLPPSEALPDTRPREDVSALSEGLSKMEFDPDKILRTLIDRSEQPPYTEHLNGII